MPFIQVTLMEGRSPETLDNLANALTDTASEVLGSDPSAIRVFVWELSGDRWYVGGTSLSEIKARKG